MTASLLELDQPVEIPVDAYPHIKALALLCLVYIKAKFATFKQQILVLTNTTLLLFVGCLFRSEITKNVAG